MILAFLWSIYGIVLKFYTFLISSSNDFPLSNSALSNLGFLFSECTHMLSISAQAGFIRGIVPWVISLYKKNFVMPLRKFCLKIHIGLLHSASPRGQLDRPCSACSCSEHGHLPSGPPPSRSRGTGRVLSPTGLCPGLDGNVVPQKADFLCKVAQGTDNHCMKTCD